MRRACFVLGLLPLLASAAPNPYLAQARVLYVGLEYERCVERLQQAAQWDSTAQERVDIELYSGLCKFDLRQKPQAAEHFRLALTLDPHVRLPDNSSPPLRVFFDDILQRMPDRSPSVATAPAPPAPIAPIDLTPRTLPAGSVIPATDVATRGPAPTRSWVLPATLGGVAIAAGIVAVVFGVSARTNEGRANAATFEVDAQRIGNDARRDALVSNISSGGAAAFSVGALLSYFLQPTPPTKASSP
ncbi:MAG: hypothetical protein ACKVPX_08935 [Myxococcaceae bacterium]